MLVASASSSAATAPGSLYFPLKTSCPEGRSPQRGGRKTQTNAEKPREAVGQATQLSEVQPALRVPRGWVGLEQACGLPSLHAGTPVLTSAMAGPCYLMSRSGSWWTGHTHLAEICATMATALLAGGTKAAWSMRVWPSHPPALQPVWPSGHSSMLCGGRLAQGVQHAVGGELAGRSLESTMSWALSGGWG